MKTLRPVFALLTFALLVTLPTAAGASSMDLTFAGRCQQEIHDLHEFFQQWSTGELPDTEEAFGRLGRALAAEFVFVAPNGSVMNRAQILEGLQDAHHRWPVAGMIEVEEIDTSLTQDDLAVFTYVEEQRFDDGRGEQFSERRSTVIFRNDPEGPNGVRWLHVHETWITPPHAAQSEAASDASRWQHSGESGHGSEHGSTPGGHGHGHGSEVGEDHGEEHGEKHTKKHGVGHGKGFHHDFSDAERWAKIFDDPERVEWQQPRHVVDLMTLEPGMQVADLGAGTGFFLGYLSRAVGPEGEVQALDVADSLVDHMNERAAKAGWTNVTSRRVATDDPGFEARTMDRILIVDVWHHIDDRGAYASKLLRALTDDGTVVVIDFTMESPEGPPKKHRIPAATVVEELEAGGLQAWIVAEETLPRQYVVMAKRPADD